MTGLACAQTGAASNANETQRPERASKGQAKLWELSAQLRLGCCLALSLSVWCRLSVACSAYAGVNCIYMMNLW